MTYVDFGNYDVVDGRGEPIVGAMTAFVVFSVVAQVIRLTFPSIDLVQVKAFDLANLIAIHPDAVGLVINLGSLLEYSVGPALGILAASVVVGRQDGMRGRALIAGISVLAVTYGMHLLGGIDIVFSGSVATIAVFLGLYYFD